MTVPSKIICMPALQWTSIANLNKERVVASAKAGGFDVKLYMTEDKSSWSMTVMPDEFTSCLVAVGSDWVDLFPFQREL